MKQKSLLEAWRYFNENYTTYEEVEIVTKMDRYVNFIAENLTLADFVPCRREMIPLPEYSVSSFHEWKYIPLEKHPADNDCYWDEIIPRLKNEGYSSGSESDQQILEDAADKVFNEEYQQALDKVVYEGWEIDDNCKRQTTISNPKTGAYIDFEYFDDNTISYYLPDIVSHDSDIEFEIKTRQDMEGFEMKEQWYKKYFNN